MKIVKLSGADLVDVLDDGEDENLVEVRQYHKDFFGDEPTMIDEDERYSIVYPPGWAKRRWLERYAGAIFQLGTMLEDRRADAHEQEAHDRLWTYLYLHEDDIYAQLNRILDEIDDVIFPELDAADEADAKLIRKFGNEDN